MPSRGTAITPQMDPQFLAFARAAGYADAEAVASGQYKINSNQAALLGRIPQYQDQEESEQKSIGDEAESRGVYSSGERVMAQNRASKALGHRMAADVNDTNVQNQNIALEMARQLAETQRRLQEEGVNSVARTTVGNAQGTLSPYL